MSRFEEFSVGKLLGKSELDNFYTRVEYDASGNVVYTHFWLENGEKKFGEFFCHYFIGNHNLSTNSIELFIDLFQSKTNIDRLCKRASNFNKTIISFLGNKYKQNFWLIKCDVCGFEAPQDISAFHRCKNCSEILRIKPFEEFRDEAYLKHANKYSYDSSSYVNSKRKTNIFCNKCQKNFMQSPDKHLRGQGCPYCRESKGERAVVRYCLKNNIKVERYKKFDGLVYKRPLNYDFYFPDENILVEFDGEHHHKPVVYNGDIESAQKNFTEVQIRDRAKDKYAMEHNIPLLRISNINKVNEDLDNFRSNLSNK